MLWREWVFTVQQKHDDRVDVSLQAFVHPALKDQGKCLGYASSFYGNPEYKGTCAIPPYGDGLFLNATSDESGMSSQSWTVETSSATESDAGVFHLVASNKPSVCLRQLGLMDCGSSAVLIGKTSTSLKETSTYTTWNLVRRYDLVPVASPPPPSHPPPPPATLPPPPPASLPPPPAPITGPTIQPYVYGQTVVMGFIEISVTSFGGNDGCAVESIVFTSVSKAAGYSTSTPAYMIVNLRIAPATVPLVSGLEYEVFAQGACSSGAMTERSNVLTVQSVAYSAPSSATPPRISSAIWNFISQDASVTWTPGKNSDPPARDPAFFVTCVPGGTPCPSSPAYDVSRPFGTITTILGLAPSAVYDCYVVAKNYNGNGVCSQKETVSTCFPGDSIVITPTGKKFISHLEVGDKVLTVSRTGMVLYEEIYLLGHKDFHSVGLFLQIHTDNNATLRLTRDHQIPFASQVDKATKYGPAAGVKVGDYVSVVSDGSTAVSLSKVTAVEEIFAQGYFNPYTMGGNIVVDGVVASCHSSFVLDELFNRVGISIPAGYQAVFGPLRVLFKAVGAKSFRNIQFLVDAIVEIVNHPHLPWTQRIRNGFCSGKG